MNHDTTVKMILCLSLLLLFLWRIKRGYKLGLVKELSNLIAIAAGLFSLCLFMLLYCSYQTHSWGTTATVVVMLVVFGLGYKLAKLILFPLKGLTALPFLRIIDKILGGAAGAAEFVAIAVALQYVLILLEQPVLFAVPELL